jgi:hypothetical protein
VTLDELDREAALTLLREAIRAVEEGRWREGAEMAADASATAFMADLRTRERAA